MANTRPLRTAVTSLAALCAVPLLSSCQKDDAWSGMDMSADASVTPDSVNTETDAGTTTSRDRSTSTKPTTTTAAGITTSTSPDLSEESAASTTTSPLSTAQNQSSSQAQNTTAGSGGNSSNTSTPTSTTTADSSSTAPGDSSDTVEETSETPTEAPDGVPGIIGVGYGGIRIVSRDNGLTWSDQSHWKGPYSDGEDKDDTYLLRSIAYGNGTWVAAGWQLTTSTDGVNWSEPLSTKEVLGSDDCGIADGMTFGKGQFLAVCRSIAVKSTNGNLWSKAGDLPNVGGHPYVVYDPESDQFALTGDNGASFTSDDGATWTSTDEDKIALCADGFTSRSSCPGFYFDGMLLKSGWPGTILRSTDGSEWDEVYKEPLEIGIYTGYSFAPGYVSP